MTVSEIVNRDRGTGFSFEILPPLKGRSIEKIFSNVDMLMEFNPLYINITTHRSEMIYKPMADGLYQRISQRSRPGTVAVAAALQNRYNIPAVPHLICSGFSKKDTEYALIDLSFLGINNLVLLRGDKAKHQSAFVPEENGHSYASELIEQVNDFNNGYFIDGTSMEIATDSKFHYGVAGYPEKHAESPNAEIDLLWLKRKVELGAEYVVTQMFFDNTKYFEFVENARKAGITVPIIPGIKPIVSLRQLNLLPNVFHVDIPSDLALELMKCKDDNHAKEVGVEWCKTQAKELKQVGVPSIHFYSLNAANSVYKVAKEIY